MADVWTDLTDAIGEEMAIQEMNKKYLNTYLSLINKKGEKLTVQYLGYQDATHQFVDILGTKLKLNHQTDYNLVCDFPERLLFNHQGMALEFVRKPTRQYKRGICKDNIQIYSPIRKMWTGDAHNWTIQTINDALNPYYPASCEAAIKALDTRQLLSIALSPKFMVSQPITEEKAYYLFYCNILIGCLKDNIFQIHHKLFNQEVIDSLDLFKPYKVEFVHAN